MPEFPSFERGILPNQSIDALIAAGGIAADRSFGEDQVQPASLDLRLGDVAFRIRTSFLPGRDEPVASKLERFCMHRVDLSDAGAVLERGCVYIVPLCERLDLPEELAGIANPKSSTGRLDVFTRLITDKAETFDRVAAGYRGPLYLEIAPRTFSILVRPGDTLNQLRLRAGSQRYSDEELRALHARMPLVHAAPGEERIEDGISMTVDLVGAEGDGLIGYKAKRHAALIDLRRVAGYAAAEFWEPIHADRNEGLILNPDDFYILASREAITVPPDSAAEMVAYDTLVGEFRVHYAGFFDPGFGWAEAGGEGTRAVLEIRSHDVPFLLEHGQTVGRLVYERMSDRPAKIYGSAIGSNYQKQTLALAKQFRRP